MAEVFVGKLHGASGFTKRYAIKQLRPELSADPDLVQMFFDEARIASSLAHPNICQIFELGEFGGRHFIAMEFLSGLTLSQLWRAALTQGVTVLPAPVTAWIIARAAEGLGYAHDKKGEDGAPLGIVHRDVSPDNLMLTEDGQVKVLDFGIARATQPCSRRTRTGLVRGKVAYMAPEYIRGEELDGRSDVFALGIVFWELLSGRELFRGQEDVQAMYAVLNPKLPDRPAGNRTPDAFWKIAEAALQREPTQRIPSAREMARRIDEALSGMGQSITTADVAKLVKVWSAAIPQLKPHEMGELSDARTQPHSPGQPSAALPAGRNPSPGPPRGTADVETSRPVTKDVASMPSPRPQTKAVDEGDARASERRRTGAAQTLAVAAGPRRGRARAGWRLLADPRRRRSGGRTAGAEAGEARRDDDNGGRDCAAAIPPVEPSPSTPTAVEPTPVAIAPTPAPAPTPPPKKKPPHTAAREHRHIAPPLPAEKLAAGSGRLALDTHPWIKGLPRWPSVGRHSAR